MTGDDRDLREYFAALRREEEAHVPAISSLSLAEPRHSRRRSAGGLAAAALCLATMISVAVWLFPGPRVPHEGLKRERGQAMAFVPSSITSWKPATDFLLRTPGSELLEGVPAIGEWPGASIAPARRNSVRKQVLP
jgi:hypothetical protein